MLAIIGSHNVYKQQTIDLWMDDNVLEAFTATRQLRTECAVACNEHGACLGLSFDEGTLECNLFRCANPYLNSSADDYKRAYFQYPLTANTSLARGLYYCCLTDFYAFVIRFLAVAIDVQIPDCLTKHKTKYSQK